MIFRWLSGLFMVIMIGWQIIPNATAASPHQETTSEPTFITYSTADSLPDNKIWTIIFDIEGRTWIGTYHGSVSTTDKQIWTSYPLADEYFDPQTQSLQPMPNGLADANVQAILPTSKGQVWFGTGGGLSVFDGQNWQSYTSGRDGLASSGITGLAIEPTGILWATHLAEGISRFDGQTWTTFTVDDGLADNWVHAAVVDNQGHIWFGTNSGVSVYDNQGWITYTTADGLVDNSVFAVAVTPDGHKWFGTTSGLSEFDGQQWVTHRANQPIAALTVDSKGYLWAAGGGRVSRFNSNTWTDYLPDHFAGQDLRTVAVSPTGEVWVGSFGAGITVFTPE